MDDSKNGTISWIVEFLAYVGTDSAKDLQIEKAMLLKNKNLPKSLFKYRKPSTTSLKNLESDTVWLCSADQYNDPYDCSVTFSAEKLRINKTKKEFDDIISESGLKNFISAEEIELARKSEDPLIALLPFALKSDKNYSDEHLLKMTQIIKDFLIKNSNELVSRFSGSMRKGMKICSFSTNHTSPAMWAHYSENHRGYCLEYSFENLTTDDIRRRILHPVIYSDNQFDASKYFLSASEEERSLNNFFGILAALYKSSDWSYEKEWRFVLPMGESFLDQDYKMPTPCAIYLGSKMTNEEKQKVARIANKKIIPLYQMRPSETEFKMIAEKL